MNPQNWPAFDQVLATLSTGPSRTGSVIVTVYGDAILPRGGSLALSDLLMLMQRLGAPGGVVRTAVSRLAKEGLIEGRRVGRRSAYALTAHSLAEFRAAIPPIYRGASPSWDGQLRLAFPEQGADRSTLEQAGFALLAPGVLVSPHPGPPCTPWLQTSGPADTMRRLAARAWPIGKLGEAYSRFCAVFAPLQPLPVIAPIDALAARIVLIHAWRRIALRDPHLPAALLPPDWPGAKARALCVALYALFAPLSEAWLDQASGGETKLPPGPDPVARFLT